MMGTYGIQTQTPHEVEPVQIWPPKELVKVYEHLGLSKRLGLQVLFLLFKKCKIGSVVSNTSRKYRVALLVQLELWALAKSIESLDKRFFATHLSSKFQISTYHMICLY